MNEPQHREYDAWHCICAELKECGIDLNDWDRLCDAIKLWGEELVELTMHDESGIEVHKRRLEIARHNYPDGRVTDVVSVFRGQR